MYPGLVLTATVIMGGFISIFILPQLVDFFASFEMNLPIPTQILLGVAMFMKSYGIITVAGVIGLGFLWSLFVATPVGKPLWHRFLLKLPIVGDMVSYGQLARFSRNLGVLLGSGVPVSRSLEVTGQSLSSIPFKDAVLSLSKNLSKGKNIGETMEDKKLRVFPMLVSRMIRVGEKSGKLEDVLLYLGEFYEEEIDSISKNLSTILEPALLIFIGLVVGFVAVAIIGPIYDLTGSIGQ
jgi:type II secretory pathway component PulF